MIVGLGNPGDRYASTRHNVGAWVVERASSRWSAVLRRTTLAREGTGRLGAIPIVLATPLAWMNQSGPAVKTLLDRANLLPDALTVVHDDLDLELGRLRFKRSGGHGGHKGILSIITALGTD
ncbi:MAG: aminoacyl-tRNA hydrolase, partial [Nitrospirales bacterium]